MVLAQTVYSGGDDCVFQGWDLRGDCSHPIFLNRKSHTMGVCCVQSHPLQEHVVATGSYDEVVRFWDARKLSLPVETCQVAVGGGVWRLKWHPSQSNLLLAACMHNGFAVLDVGSEGLQPGLGDTQAMGGKEEMGKPSVVEHYSGHDSLGYGADWCYKDPEWDIEENVVASLNGFGDRAVADELSEKQDVEEYGFHSDQQATPSEANISAVERTSKEYNHGGEQYRKKRRLVATCSFYDKGLHLWRTKAM